MMIEEDLREVLGKEFQIYVPPESVLEKLPKLKENETPAYLIISRLLSNNHKEK